MIKHKTNAGQKGFTLIELSIVLVIIGLIVGGVLVGQDLIKAAQVRATVSQYEKYNTAANTFRTKYNYMPGDLCAGACATGLGFISRAGDSTNGVIPGNRLLETVGAGADASKTIAGYETTFFWQDLSTANLIDGSFTQETVEGLSASVTAATAKNYYPAAKLSPTNYFLVWNDGSYNYYTLTGVASTNGSGTYTLTSNLTPIDANNIDIKVDDGKPSTGVVQGVVSTSNLGGGGATTNCINGTVYYIATNGSTPYCQLTMRFN